MRPHLRLVGYRISNIRPLRPPNICSTRPRLFSTKPPSNARPQLPFLPSTSRIAFLRSLSTTTRSGFRYHLRFWGLTLLALWASVKTISLCQGYLNFQWLERLYPCPPEWGFFMRYSWCMAQHELALDKSATGIPNWSHITKNLERLLRYAWETPGVEPNDDFDDSIPGIDKTFITENPLTPLIHMPRLGKDVSSQPEDWRHCYFQAWMDFALVQEKRFGEVVDTTRKIAFPKKVMVGPSNPNPERQRLPNGVAPPLEENCVPGGDDPTDAYTHILTTKGFSVSQRIDAALAWASWLDYEGDSATAMQLCDWSLDLASTALQDQGINPKSIVDPRTKIIKASAPFVTSNILKICTKTADFQAKHNDLSSALNIYTSVLRAYRGAPDAPLDKQYAPKQLDYTMETMDGAKRFLRSLYHGMPSPTLPPSGDSPFQHTQHTKCDEALVMTYVGEILFATGSKDAGLVWTRDATALAEKGFTDENFDRPSHLACSRCMGAALENWHRMTSALVAEEATRKVFDQKTGEPVAMKRSLLDSLLHVFGGGDPLARLVAKGDWHSEYARVQEQRNAYMERRLLNEMEATGKNRHLVRFYET